MVLLVAPLLGFSQQKITVPDLDKIYLTGQTNKDWRYDTSYRNDSLNFISTMNGMDFLMRIIVIKDTLAFCDIECTKADFDKFVEDAVSSNPLVKVASFKSETSDAYGYYFKNTNRHLYYSFYYRASGNMLLVVSGVRT